MGSSRKTLERLPNPLQDIPWNRTASQRWRERNGKSGKTQRNKEKSTVRMGTTHPEAGTVRLARRAWHGSLLALPWPQSGVYRGGGSRWRFLCHFCHSAFPGTAPAGWGARRKRDFNQDFKPDLVLNLTLNENFKVLKQNFKQILLSPQRGRAKTLDPFPG